MEKLPKFADRIGHHQGLAYPEVALVQCFDDVIGDLFQSINRFRINALPRVRALRHSQWVAGEMAADRCCGSVGTDATRTRCKAEACPTRTAFTTCTGYWLVPSAISEFSL